MTDQTTAQRRSTAFKNLLHEASMYRYHERTQTLHPYDSSKVDGAALELAEAIRADELASRQLGGKSHE